MKNSHSNVDQKQLHPIILSLEQYQATELLAIGKTDVEVAQLMGVDEVTIYQWRQKPEFAAAFNMLRVASSNSSGATEETEKTEPVTTLVDVSRF